MVEVASHTDSRGKESYNDKLASRRTNSAIDYLESAGVPRIRLIARAYGEYQPVAPNELNGRDNPKGRQLNRRTEFRITEGVDENGKIRIELPADGSSMESSSSSYVPAPITYEASTSSSPVLSTTTTSVTTTSTYTAPAPKVEMVAEEAVQGNYARMTFKKNYHDFGTMKAGDSKTHVFTFTNTGNVDLLIEFASGSCGCTVPAWPEDPIPPGEMGEIHVEYNSKDKSGEQLNDINIIANTEPIVTELKIRAMVK